MPVNVVLGGQWGDEGKGKIVDTLCDTAQIVARFQGGPNAGHTIYREDRKFVLHQLPSGILKDGVLCLLGHGMVIDPVELSQEIAGLTDQGIRCGGRIRISPYANIITPWHKELDRLQEESRNDGKQIGTTRKGIGPAYSDHINRQAMKAWQLADPAALKSILKDQSERVRQLFPGSELNSGQLQEAETAFLSAAAEAAPLVQDFSADLRQAIADHQEVLIEGAQGLLLDVQFGTYPFVTSSSTGSAGILAGLPLSFRDINTVSGIFKAYTTRVGNGPFPTELLDETGESLRRIGSEFGATTGRPRRCGWLDLVLARYAIRINGINRIILTKIDVLSEFDSIDVAVAYEYEGKTYDDADGLIHRLADVTPVYRRFPGWNSDISAVKRYQDLPVNLRKYIEFIESFTGTSVGLISTGTSRDSVIIR